LEFGPRVLDAEIPPLSIGLALENSMFAGIKSHDTNHTVGLDHNELLVPLGTLLAELLEGSVVKVIGNDNVVVTNKFVIGRNNVSRVLNNVRRSEKDFFT
jgi:hypothetical protein